VKAVELIRKKRDGEVHTVQEIEFLVDGAVHGTIPDYQLSAWLMAVRLKGMNREETDHLTQAMARSGRILDLSSIPGRKVDKHSTGGVGDKATLVVAPLVAAAGVPVAKLSGRALGHSGGTLDKLEAIPGLRVDLTPEEFVSQVRKVGIAIAGQTADMVPADKVLYALRDTTATVDSVPLIASSVMSKKIAAGADAILLDVKVGHGAFVGTLQEADVLARALVALGEGAGRETVAYVTDMSQPLGRAVGNALEVEEAIDTLAGKGPPELVDLSLRLAAEMLRMAGIAYAEKRVNEVLKKGEGLRKLAEMIEAQGGDRTVCEDPSRLPQAPVHLPLAAERAGCVAEIDALEVALTSKALGAGRDRKEDPIDYSVGIVLHKKVGDAVASGETLAQIHAKDDGSAKAALSRLSAAFQIADRAESPPLIRRRVSASGVEVLA
jgi:pyrimidine-nucleoside phosphorylase